MEMQKRPQGRVESRSSKGRDKIEMAWRHKSKSEKNLIKLIGFLIFALICFIIAVISMDVAFKKRIHNLEDELNALQSTDSPNSTVITTFSTMAPKINTTVDDETTLTSTVITTTVPAVTTTVATDTTESTTDSETTNDTTDGEDTTAPGDSTGPTGALFESLRSLLTNFNGLKKSTKSIEKTTKKGGYVSRSHGTFIIMADINHEESELLTPEPETNTEEPYVYIDGNETSTESPTTEDDFSSTFVPETVSDDMEDDLEPTTDAPIDDLLMSIEGSGD